jgi:hypothetical protein
MRYLLVLPLALLFLAGCAKTDREQLNGKWGIQEIKTGGEIIFSPDKAKQEKALDRIVQQQLAMAPPEAQSQAEMLKEMFRKNLEMVGKTTLEIKEDNSFKFSSYNGADVNDTKGTLTIDEKKKEINLKSEKEEKFSYTLKEDVLTLSRTEGEQKTELVFKKKK